MKQFAALTVVILFAAVFSAPALSEGPEASMYTLSDIYYYLTEGVVAIEGGHDLEPPAGAVPGDTRFHSLAQIYEAIEGMFDDASGAGPENVREGKVFFSTDPAAWGLQTGTTVIYD